MARANATVYLNGQKVLSAARSEDHLYHDEPFADSAKAALKLGKNVIAIHLLREGDTPGFDIGIIER
jgi:hypothetical protein